MPKGYQGTLYENLYHHTVPQLPSSRPAVCSVRSKFMTTELEALHSHVLSFPPFTIYFIHIGLHPK